MKKLQFLYILSFAFFSQILLSQQRNTSNITKEIIKTHYYTFDGNATQEKLDGLQQALVQLDFVTEAKIKYKFEKNAGQIIILTKEQTVVTENQKEFSPTIIKKTIINFGLMPIQYTLAETVSK